MQFQTTHYSMIRLTVFKCEATLQYLAGGDCEDGGRLADRPRSTAVGAAAPRDVARKGAVGLATAARAPAVIKGSGSGQVWDQDHVQIRITFRSVQVRYGIRITSGMYLGGWQVT